MSEIKKLIELFKNCDKVKFIASGCGEEEHKTIEFKPAIEILEEKLEREQGCEYCDGKHHVISKYDVADIMKIYYNSPVKAWYLYLEDSDNDLGVLNCEIKYCPMCGRRLQNE